jgi:type 1 glutamine amidotransferase
MPPQLEAGWRFSKIRAPVDFSSVLYFAAADRMSCCNNRLFLQTKLDGPHVANGDVEMPVVWTKMYGEGRVFYSSIGHNTATVREPDPLRFLVRGLLWAAHAEDRA